MPPRRCIVSGVPSGCSLTASRHSRFPRIRYLWRRACPREGGVARYCEVRIRFGRREVAVHKLAAGRRQRVIDSAHFEGVAGRNGAVRRQAIGAPPPLHPPALLRPLAEDEALIGGSF